MQYDLIKVVNDITIKTLHLATRIRDQDSHDTNQTRNEEVNQPKQIKTTQHQECRDTQVNIYRTILVRTLKNGFAPRFSTVQRTRGCEC